LPRKGPRARRDPLEGAARGFPRLDVPDLRAFCPSMSDVPAMPLAEDRIPLADDFPPAAREQWEALAARSLKGRSLESLRSRTADGVVIEPLHPPAGTAAAVRPAPRPDRDRPWDLRALVDHPDPAQANAHALEELENGAASLLLPLDPSGETGVAVAGRDDLARVLDGVLLDLAPVALDAGWMGPQAADWLAELAKGGPAAPLRFNLDPLGAFALQGVSPGPLAAHVAAAAATGARHAAAYPRARLFLASGQAAHEAGGSEGWELGLALAGALAYARALSEAGMPPAEAFGRISLGLSADVECFTTIAKLRAARLLWAKLATACGAPAPAVLEVRSARRMLAALDAWTNLLRLTAAGFGAAAGGAEVVILDAFTAPLGRPAPLARRQARNIQLILMEEAGLGRVADPAGGSGHLEALTDGLARAGWAAFQAMERAGGAAEALKSGVIAEAVAAARDARTEAYVEDRLGLIGVTRFPNPDAQPPAVEPVDAAPFARPAPDVSRPGTDDRCPALRPIRWAQPFEGGAA